MRKFIIKNGQICDGISKDIFQADILIENDRIKDIAPVV